MGGLVGKLPQHLVQVLGHLLAQQTPRLAVFGDVPEQQVLAGGIPLPQGFGQVRIRRRIVALDLGQEPLERHAQQPRAAQLGHVAEHVRRVQPLLVDLGSQHLDQTGGHVVHHPLGQFVLLEVA